MSAASSQRGSGAIQRRPYRIHDLLQIVRLADDLEGVESFIHAVMKAMKCPT